MSEGPSNIISRELINSCEQESKVAYNTRVVELSSSTHQPKEEEHLFQTSKLANSSEEEKIKMNASDLSLRERQKNYQPDSSLILHQLGTELLYNCLIWCSRSDYGTIASLNHNFRSLIRSEELYKLRRKAGIIEYWIYYSCNPLEWEAFDPIRARWIRLPRMPLNESFMLSAKESLAVGTELLVFGMGLWSPVVYKYNILSCTWSSEMTMNTPRCLFASASLGEIAVLAGGCDPFGNVLSSAELYNSENGEWETLPCMNKARKKCSAVFMNGKFYVIGGIGDDNSTQLTCGEEFDLKKRRWRIMPNMFLGSQNIGEAPPLVAVVKDAMYAVDYAERMIKRYNKGKDNNDLWVTIGMLPERVDSMNGWGLAFRGCGDKLIVIGGRNDLGPRVVDVNACVPGEGATLQWNFLARRQVGTFVYNSTVMGC